MIGSPDVVAFTKEDDFGDSFSDPCSLPEEFSVPLFAHAANANPWTKTSYAKFSKDFILVSEFSEQVGPQPLLTIPNDPKVCGTFDLNYFSLRIMSVDYQASFVGHPPGSNYPKLNFVEDSKVVLGDSKEGAFAYVHHLTLYDLEARGFVRPFCMAYISADEKKIMHQFQELSSEFSQASEFLKSGNRKAFANELEKKLKDLEYTRSVLHKETELQKKNNGCYSTQAIEKANELANVEKSIYEHKDLLRQITSYPSRKKKDVDFVQRETEKLADISVLDDTLNSNHSDIADKTVETESDSRKSSYTPQLIKAKSAKCFDKRLKTMEELCDANFFHQTLEQLNITEKSFRGDLCFIYTSQIGRALLGKQRVTSFLFEEWEKEGTSKNLNIFSHNPTVPILNLPGELLSLESYTTCIDIDHIKPGVESMEGPPESSLSDITQETSEAADTETKGSFSSDKSIEAFGGVSPSSLQTNYFDGLERKSKVSIASPSESASSYVAVPQKMTDGNLVPMDAACCIGQDGFIFGEPLPELAQECCGDTVVNQEPLSLLQGDPALQVDYILEESALAESPNMGLTFSELNTGVLSEEVAKINIEYVSDSTSFMSASTSSDRAVSPFTYGSALTLKQKKKAGHSALRFIRQYPFAQQAIFCLLSGRTLVILGVDEGTVRKLVNALFFFVPNLGKYGETVQPWLSSPFQLTDLQRWKLIGLQRAASPAGSSILHSLNRYSRYISILDCDSKTLRCPPYKGTLISHLADHRTQIKRGSTYFLHVQGMLTQLTAKAFLYTFCHHIHLPMDINDQGSVTSRRTNFLLQLGYTVEESKIVQYLSELIKQHYIQGSSMGGDQSFCFNYTTSYLYKI
ncbi:Smith-Magenis syndrome chromosomal region candidate gene 8 protein homolog isoform X1 [Sinocyclocheilus grahami]|uniref:Smith-Magenis syndrome chromosomal region candidate gene 8 protein homolog n=1 Tax=Sinocyclocheilus grahami TaxID=75366 RepID=A0A672RVC7_SINGR|nr:PREDICTED: Smith-Magenis syndrome chromosomal region candidate gene 8 protein homolog isoform X1 [Sinocyclocheilus grahami]